MRDDEIVELYWQRNPDAIRETEIQYGAWLTKAAMNILNDAEDSREAVNDAYYRAWCTMPDYRPAHLKSYLSKLVRGTAIDIWRSRHSDKRKSAEYTLSLEELADVVTDTETPEEVVSAKMLGESIRAFVNGLNSFEKAAFLGRYYYADSIKEISGYLRVSPSKVKNTLFSLRKKLKSQLEKEGYTL